MNKLEQAARQALEALEELFHSNSTKVAVEKYNTAHNALREALAEQAVCPAEQAEQEPVAWQSIIVPTLLSIDRMESDEWRPLYAAPVRTKDLTDDEIANKIPHQPVAINMIDFARAVIAADRENNK